MRPIQSVSVERSMLDRNLLINSYYTQFAKYKRDLFSLYNGESLERRIVPQGNGYTWGYRLMVGNEPASGSSIGEDEIRLLYDIVHLIDAQYAFSVGVAYGFSTFVLALARNDLVVYGIDNYTERPGPATNYAQQLVERIIAESFDNVQLYVGTSPTDTDKCLASLPENAKLSLVIIDGLHTDLAASKDYYGVRRYIDSGTVILWHNTYSTRHAFYQCFDRHLFDRSYVLHTYGAMGVYYHSGKHPKLDSYLGQNCLIWDNWEHNYFQLLHQARDVSISGREEARICLNRLKDRFLTFFQLQSLKDCLSKRIKR